MRKFWNWVRDEATEERTLYLNGEISDETWWGDEVTPKLFKDELMAGSGNVTVWINSPGGDVFAAAQMATVNSKNTGDELGLEIRRLRDEKQALQNEQASRQELKKRIDEMTDFLNEQSCELEEYDEQLVRRLIEKVTVFNDKLIVEFKSGVEIDIDIKL